MLVALFILFAVIYSISLLVFFFCLTLNPGFCSTFYFSPLPLLSIMVRFHLKGGVWKNTEDEILKAAVMKYGTYKHQ